MSSSLYLYLLFSCLGIFDRLLFLFSFIVPVSPSQVQKFYLLHPHRPLSYKFRHSQTGIVGVYFLFTHYIFSSISGRPTIVAVRVRNTVISIQITSRTITVVSITTKTHTYVHNPFFQPEICRFRGLSPFA